MKKFKKMKMNELDLINEFSKEQLQELLKIQIEHENYEGANIIKSAIEQYDECVGFELFFNIENDKMRDDDLYFEEDEDLDEEDLDD